MSIPNTSEKSVDLDRQENITKGNVSVKKIAVYAYNSGSDTLIPVSVKQNSAQLLGTDQALVTNTVMHGLSSAGGGSYVDVKVNPSGSLLVEMSTANTLADYGIQAISEDATYKYFFFEDSSANWYVLRKHLANATFDYAKGTGGYASVYVDSTSGPSGSPTYGSKGTIF